MGSPYIYFMEEVNSLIDTDYGDFMRKVNSYLTILKENKIAKLSPEISDKINDMQNYVQYSPSWDIPSTKEKVLHDADTLIHLESQNTS